jgi:hypothetical protein
MPIVPYVNGGAVIYGGQPTYTGLEFITWETGGAEKVSEEVPGAAGAVFSEVVQQVCERIDFEARSKTLSVSQIKALFPEHQMCAMAGYTTYRVDSCKIMRSAGALKITGSLMARFATATP